MGIRTNLVGFIALTGAALVAPASLAELSSLCHMFPPNNFSYPDRGNHAIGQMLFEQILNQIRSTYNPLFQRLGVQLVIDGQWNEPHPDASSDASPDRRIRRVQITGGLARAPGMTADAVLLATCHELGHHLGGAPLMPQNDGPRWATAEGGADYYASLKCMRVVLRGTGSAAAVQGNMPSPPGARLVCSRAYADPEMQGICLRTAAAAQVLSQVINMIVPQTPVIPRIDTPDRTVSPGTMLGYPSLQCRLDTFIAGAVCDANPYALMGYADPGVASCDDHRIHPAGGQRPRCWFNPADPLGLSNTPPPQSQQPLPQFPQFRARPFMAFQR